MSECTQSCIFCSKKREQELSVYSLGLGRLGICLDCAIKAVKALLDHGTNTDLRGTFEEIGGLQQHERLFGLNDEDQHRLISLKRRVSIHKAEAKQRVMTQIFE